MICGSFFPPILPRRDSFSLQRSPPLPPSSKSCAAFPLGSVPPSPLTIAPYLRGSLWWWDFSPSLETKSLLLLNLHVDIRTISRRCGKLSPPLSANAPFRCMGSSNTKKRRHRLFPPAFPPRPSGQTSFALNSLPSETEGPSSSMLCRLFETMCGVSSFPKNGSCQSDLRNRIGR